MFIKILPALMAVLFAVVSLEAQIRQPPADISIRGKIFLSTGQAADRMEVRLERAEMQVLASTYTDGIGNFEFRNLTVGAYYVVVKAEGYDEVRQYVDTTSMSKDDLQKLSDDMKSWGPVKKTNITRFNLVNDVWELGGTAEFANTTREFDVSAAQVGGTWKIKSVSFR